MSWPGDLSGARTSSTGSAPAVACSADERVALLLFVMATFAVVGSVAALVAPRSELWWGNRNFPRPQWRMGATNMWMFNDKDGRTPSPAGVVLVRAVGCVLLVAAVALTVSAFKQL